MSARTYYSNFFFWYKWLNSPNQQDMMAGCVQTLCLCLPLPLPLIHTHMRVTENESESKIMIIQNTKQKCVKDLVLTHSLRETKM